MLLPWTIWKLEKDVKSGRKRRTKFDLGPFGEIVLALAGFVDLEPLCVTCVKLVAGRVAAGGEVGQDRADEVWPLLPNNGNQCQNI